MDSTGPFSYHDTTLKGVTWDNERLKICAHGRVGESLEGLGVLPPQFVQVYWLNFN